MTITAGDHVKILESPSTVGHGWDGLTAVVLSTQDHTFIRLDENCRRPDGTGGREFVWPTEFLEVITDPRITRLETELAEWRRIADERLSAHELFKSEVVRVATERARDHNWCGVVVEALDELGLETTRRVEIRVTASAWITVPVCANAELESSVSSLVLSLDSDYDNEEHTLTVDSIEEL